MAGTGKKQMRAFTVAPWWGLLIVSGQKTIENRTFRVKEGRYLVHCSSSCSESAYLDAVRWVMNRPQLSGVKMPSFRECRDAAERWPVQMAAAVHWIRAAQLVEVLAGCALGLAVMVAVAARRMKV